MVQQIPVNLCVERLLKAMVERPREYYWTVCTRKVGLVRIGLLDSGINALCLNFVGLDSSGPMKYLVSIIPDQLTECPECFYQRRSQEF